MNTRVPSHPTRSAPLRLSHVPLPTILYLMAWTGLTAFVLVVFKRGLGASTPDVISAGFMALAATAVGWIYLGGLLILRHAARGTLWPLEPGEWLS